MLGANSSSGMTLTPGRPGYITIYRKAHRLLPLQRPSQLSTLSPSSTLFEPPAQAADGDRILAIMSTSPGPAFAGPRVRQTRGIASPMDRHCPTLPVRL